MDFSFLDKEEYRNISLYDVDSIGIDANKKISIRKYLTNIPIELHRHSYIQINYVINGTGTHTIANMDYEINKGDIFVIPPFIPHKITSNINNPMEIMEFEFSADYIRFSDYDNSEGAIYMDFAYIEPFIVSEEHVKPRFKLSPIIQRKVEDILYEALAEYENKTPGYHLLIKALLLKLLVIVGREYSNEIKDTETEKLIRRYKDMIKQSVEYINENYDKNITLNDMLHISNYSRSYYSYLFKTVTGYTFVEYLNYVRVEKAIDLLKKQIRRL